LPGPEVSEPLRAVRLHHPGPHPAGGARRHPGGDRAAQERGRERRRAADGQDQGQGRPDPPARRQPGPGRAAGRLPGPLRRLAGALPAGGPHRQGEQGRHPPGGPEDVRGAEPHRRLHRVDPDGRWPQRGRPVMTRSTPLALALLALLPWPGLVLAQPTDWRQIPKPPLRPFQPTQPRRVALANGMVVLLQEDHELPLVSGFARIRGGAREEPAEKTGLVEILGEAWRTGGTTQKTGDQLDDFLEARAATVETSGGLDSTSISFDCLKGNFDEVWGVFLEVLRDPAFRDDKIALAKNQVNTGIARRNDDAGGIASREARK